MKSVNIVGKFDLHVFQVYEVVFVNDFKHDD